MPVGNSFAEERHVFHFLRTAGRERQGRTAAGPAVRTAVGTAVRTLVRTGGRTFRSLPERAGHALFLRRKAEKPENPWKNQKKTPEKPAKRPKLLLAGAMDRCYNIEVSCG